MKEEESRLIPVHIFDIYPYPDPQQGLAAPQNFLVLLKGDEKRVVPINIGHFEGQALAMAIRKIAMPRPLPHDLLRSLLEKIDAQDEPFYLDWRPSDGMILATLLATPIFMSPEVIETAGRVLEITDQRVEVEGEPAIDRVLESLESHDVDPGAVHSALEESEAIEEMPKLEISDVGITFSAEDLIDPETGAPMRELGVTRMTSSAKYG